MGHYSKWFNATSDRLSGFDRVRVDPSQTSFWEGREFHFIDEFSLAAGATKVLKIVAPCDTIVFDLSYTLDAGWIRAALCTGGTEGGTFSTPVHVHPANNMAVGPDHRDYGGGLPYQRQVTLFSGGTHTGGEELEIVRLKVADNSNFATSFGSGGYMEHGMGIGTYYLRIHNIGNITATGVVKSRWEERP